MEVQIGVFTFPRSRIPGDKDEIADLSEVSDKAPLLPRDRKWEKPVEEILKFFLIVIIHLNTSSFCFR